MKKDYTNIAPIKLLPAFKDYIWGGIKLKTEYNKKTDLDIVAESWELSAHSDGQSKVTGGEFDGLSLNEYLEKVGKTVLGTKAEIMDHFPILIKFIDAKKDLSIQVHPDDAYALRVEGGLGKTEMWYVLDCEDDAYLCYGFNRPVTKDELRQRIENNTILDVLNRVKVHAGDVFFIPAGTIHAIGAGMVICEIQQNSNTTYRVYDYNRKGKDGKPRELHIEKAIDVATLTKAPECVMPDNCDDAVLAECEYFNVRRLKINGCKNMKIDDSSFHSLIITKGSGILKYNGEEMSVAKGDSIFIPAQNGEYTLKAEAEVILTKI